jgi:hypothetical protein
VVVDGDDVFYDAQDIPLEEELNLMSKNEASYLY